MVNIKNNVILFSASYLAAADGKADLFTEEEKWEGGRDERERGRGESSNGFNLYRK